MSENILITTGQQPIFNIINIKSDKHSRNPWISIIYKSCIDTILKLEMDKS